jgi:hypothetical protein
LGFRLCRRREPLASAAVSLCCRLTEDHADLILHGAAMAGSAQTQQGFELVVELADGQAGQGLFPCIR